MKHIEQRDNVRHSAFINFSRDIVSFLGRPADHMSRVPTACFLSASEIQNTVQLELTTDFLSISGGSFASDLNERLPMFYNLEIVFLNISCDSIEGDEWRCWEDGPDHDEIGSVSAGFKEAWRIWEEIKLNIWKTSSFQRWKLPLLVMEPWPETRGLRQRSVEELKCLIEDFLSA